MNMSMQNAGVFALAIGFAVVVAAIMGVVLQDLSADIEADYGNNSTAASVTSNGLEGLSNFTGTFDIVGTIAGFAIVLGVLGGIGFVGYQGYQRFR